MTIDQIKEQLSNRYIGVLAANKGYIIDKGDLDQGVDFTAKKSFVYTPPGSSKQRYTTDGRYIDIQLKATTEGQIINEPTQIKYDLEVKNYNDMVVRLGGITPLILILFVLPDNRNDWVDLTPTELKLRRIAYWYQPPIGSAQTTNQYTIRITIPKTNQLGIDCFDILHGQFYP